MITKDGVMPLLLQACPSFQSGRQRYAKTEGQDLLYVSLGNFADHLLELHQKNHTDEFPAVADAIERLHVEGDHYVIEAATIGLLEGIQNVWANKRVDPELFYPLLRPQSAKWWQSLNDFWQGKIGFVGDGL